MDNPDPIKRETIKRLEKVLFERFGWKGQTATSCDYATGAETAHWVKINLSYLFKEECKPYYEMFFPFCEKQIKEYEDKSRTKGHLFIKIDSGVKLEKVINILETVLNES